mgnify:CR=1 FL=1
MLARFCVLLGLMAVVGCGGSSYPLGYFRDARTGRVYYYDYEQKGIVVETEDGENRLLEYMGQCTVRHLLVTPDSETLVYFTDVLNMIDAESGEYIDFIDIASEPNSVRPSFVSDELLIVQSSAREVTEVNLKTRRIRHVLALKEGERYFTLSPSGRRYLVKENGFRLHCYSYPDQVKVCTLVAPEGCWFGSFSLVNELTVECAVGRMFLLPFYKTHTIDLSDKRWIEL